MDIRQLRYFVKVVELSNITAAAEALHIAQPSLSQHMLNLESELEVRLLEVEEVQDRRGGRGSFQEGPGSLWPA